MPRDRGLVRSAAIHRDRKLRSTLPQGIPSDRDSAKTKGYHPIQHFSQSMESVGVLAALSKGLGFLTQGCGLQRSLVYRHPSWH